MSNIVIDESRILQLEEDRVTLRNNLRSQGVPCADDETLDSLVTKVASVQSWKKYTDKSMDGVAYNTTATVVDNFQGFSSLKGIVYNNATSLGGNAYAKNCVALQKIVLPRITTFNSYTLENDTAMALADIGSASAWGDQRTNSPSFSKLIMRKSDSICTLANISYLASTKFRNGGGGIAYTPNALISTYEGATNWSSLESATFVSIEGSRFEDLDWHDDLNSKCTLDGNEIEVLDNETVAVFKHTENISHCYEDGVELQDTDLVKGKTLTSTV